MRERERQSGVGRGGGVFNTIDLLEKGILIYFLIKKIHAQIKVHVL